MLYNMSSGDVIRFALLFCFESWTRTSFYSLYFCWVPLNVSEVWTLDSDVVYTSQGHLHAMTEEMQALVLFLR
jgi:hypothetical protein